MTIAVVAAVAILIAAPQLAQAQWTWGWPSYAPYTSYYTPYYGSYYAPYGYYGYTVPYTSYYYGYSYPYYAPQTTFRLGPLQIQRWY